MKESQILLGVALTGLFMAAAVLIGPRIIIAFLCDRDEDRKTLDAQSDFFCPVDRKIVYNAWGECGLMKVCIDPSNGSEEGSLFTAQGGLLQSKALYSRGKHVGGWTGYDPAGKSYPKEGGYSSPVEQPINDKGDIVLALKDVQFFKAQEISTSPLTIRLSGLAFHSSLAVRNITVAQSADALQVLVHLTPTASGMSGNFSYDLVVAESINTISFGEERALIWDRSAGVVNSK